MSTSSFAMPEPTPAVNPVQQTQRNYASRGLRFGGIFLEALFMLVTLFIGWIIWSLVVWGRGQTPAKQVLRMRVMNEKTDRPAEWGQMAIRQFVIPFTLGIGFDILLAISGNWSLAAGGIPSNFNFGLVIIYIFYMGWWLFDALWITRPEHQRLIDVIARTYVVKE